MSRQAATIPFFGGARQFAEHEAALMEAARAVLASGRTLQGPAVECFEASLAQLTGRRHAVAVGSATDALFFALAGLEIGPGDEVLVPAVSFIASASCVLRAGARPVFVDVDEHLLIDLAAARELVGPRTRAMIAVDLFGQMPDPAALDAFAVATGVAVVEDAAQALGGCALGRPAGSLGAVGCFSFDPTKPLAAPGSGGALLCDDDEVARRARALRRHGRDGDGDSPFRVLGYNSLLPEVAAAMLELKLGWEPASRARRRAIAARYDAALAGTRLRPLPRVAHDGHAFQKYVVRTGERPAVAAALARTGVPTRVHYPRPLHREPCFATHVVAGSVAPRADAATAEVLSLPIHAQLRDDEVQRVIDALRDIGSRAA